MQYPIMLKMADGTEKQFWLSDEKLQFGGEMELPIATQDTYGAIKVQQSWRGFGVLKNASGCIFVAKAFQSDIEKKTNEYNAIVPSTINCAVRAGLLSNSLITANDQSAICKTIGAKANSAYKLVAELTVNEDGVSSVAVDVNVNDIIVYCLMRASAETDEYLRVYITDDKGVNKYSQTWPGITQNKFRHSMFTIQSEGGILLKHSYMGDYIDTIAPSVTEAPYTPFGDIKKLTVSTLNANKHIPNGSMIRVYGR